MIEPDIVSGAFYYLVHKSIIDLQVLSSNRPIATLLSARLYTQTYTHTCTQFFTILFTQQMIVEFLLPVRLLGKLSIFDMY